MTVSEEFGIVGLQCSYACNLTDTFMLSIDDLRAIFFYGTIEQNWLGHQMAEIYKDEIYRPFLPLQKQNTLALDIGGNIGLCSLYLSRYFEKIITLEPSFEHFDALVRNLQTNKADNVKPIKKALFIKNGKYPFGGPKGNKTMQTLHMSQWQDGKPSDNVDTISLDKLFEEEKINHVDLMKIDVEGTETEIISSLSFKKVSSKIDLIIGELHYWNGRHPNQLKDALKSNGFSYETLEKLTASELFVAKK